MTIQTMDDGAKFIATSSEILIKNQISITIGSDFTEFRDIISAERSQQGVSLPFDPEVHDLHTGNACWVIGRDSEGTLIHSQATRLINLGGKSLGDFMLKGFKEFPPALPDIDFERSRFRPTPGAKHILGRVIYHGEIWLGGDANLYRGTGLSTVLVRLGVYEALKRWNPDFLFGFVAHPVAYKGFIERGGYFHAEPGALKWVRKGSDKAMEGFLTFLSNEEARFLFELPIADAVSEPAAKSRVHVA